ncbi:hypothetical protein VOLCADRAFT_92085 [Volvox carteri f. nagariensis]|uniref:Uncharacterized protein n=1 Tax=Volvox carteri f. nagariensis TaxID=3068 RepID=D8TYJ8_VOLCA|nr:uncharacterized protein VOLCADRAFT_92085 [Volvox carteri f. nagariensis]EFJ47409.1 hypothetical protein VOLCADRAFT_92085 [Volvox carteri f. nagariensis]|eukprot:XP_002951598.1 hypothetical protein VOLCADRAFT_92085 [Volvox carteri f. nagariensis]
MPANVHASVLALLSVSPPTAHRQLTDSPPGATHTLQQGHVLRTPQTSPGRGTCAPSTLIGHPEAAHLAFAPLPCLTALLVSPSSQIKFTCCPACRDLRCRRCRSGISCLGFCCCSIERSPYGAATEVEGLAHSRTQPSRPWLGCVQEAGNRRPGPALVPPLPPPQGPPWPQP